MTVRPRLWRELRPFVGPVLVVLAYAALRSTHAGIAGDRGILTPSGSLDSSLAALAFATFLLRLLALVVVPFVVVHRLATRALHGWTRAERPSP
jgi:hypothetical protein